MDENKDAYKSYNILKMYIWECGFDLHKKKCA